MVLDLPGCAACGGALPPSRAIDSAGMRVTTCCPGCLTIEEFGHRSKGEWTSAKVVMPGAEVARERDRFVEELAAGTLSRTLGRRLQRFRHMAVPEIFEVARPLFHRPARFHRAQGLAVPSDLFPAVHRRFLQDWRTPPLFSAGEAATIAGVFGHFVMVEAPDGGTPLCVVARELDLGMPSTRLVIRGPNAAEANGRLALVVDDEERETPVRVESLSNNDPYIGGETWSWSATLSDRGDSLFLLHWIKKSNPGFDETERIAYGTIDGGRTWTRIPDDRVDAELDGAELLHQLDPSGTY